eukprot:scaffold222535_cov29-Tisochrysis_lutea.AAC.1
MTTDEAAGAPTAICRTGTPAGEKPSAAARHAASTRSDERAMRSRGATLPLPSTFYSGLSTSYSVPTVYYLLSIVYLPSVESSGRRTSSREARRAQLRTDAGRAACPFSAIHPDGGLTTAVPSLERGEGRHVRRIGRHIALLRIRIRAGRETRGRGNLPPVSR